MSITVISHPPVLVLSKQPISFTVQTDSTETPLRIVANPSFGSEVWDSVQPDQDGKASFEFSDYLKDIIKTRMQTGNVPVEYDNVPFTFNVTFSEYSGTPPVLQDQTINGPYSLLDGCIPKSRKKSLYATYPNVLSYLFSSKSCLTWWPSSEKISILPTQRQFLNYMQLTSDAPITINLDLHLYFTSGAHYSRGAQFTVTPVPKYSVIYFPVDYTSLDIAAQAALYSPLVLSHYVVSVRTGPVNFSLPLSQNYSYVPDFGHYDHARILYIRNSFGFLEILRCQGESEQVNSFKIETVRTDGRFLPEKVNWKMEKTDKVKVDTGFMTAAQIQWLSDFDFLEAYEQIGEVLHPIVFTDMDIPVVHDGVYQYSASLEYEYSYEEKTEVG